MKCINIIWPRLIAATALFLAMSAPVSAIAVLDFLPTATSTSVGQLITLDVRGSALSDLYGYQFSITYDHTVLKAINIIEGPFLAIGGSTFFIPGSIDNTAGIVSFTGNTLIGAIPGVSGGGILASLTFESIGVGSSGLGFQDVLLLDSSINLADVNTYSGLISIVTNTVPEPNGLALLTIGSLALLGAFHIPGIKK